VTYGAKVCAVLINRKNSLLRPARGGFVQVMVNA
jgi:hypothetical protein